MEMPNVYRPIPRRPFEITPASTDSSHPPSPATESVNSDLLHAKRPDETPSRTRSILNLTSSTLLGIYSPIGTDGNREEMSTPWGTGAQTPSHRRSVDEYKPQESYSSWLPEATRPKPKPKKKGFRGLYAPLLMQTALLFGFGVGYGAIITHLHKTQRITPVPVIDVDRNSLYYQLSWGLFGIILGNALPFVDSVWAKSSLSHSVSEAKLAGSRRRTEESRSERSEPPMDSGLGPMWYSAVRSIGVFVGIAFAVRRLPWTSTLQVALTLALANPVLWYIIDRSFTGFAFSTVVGTTGSLILLLVDPDFVPLPAIHQPMASEKIGVFTWLASILFCTSICFGAIGRRLQL